MIGCTNGVYKVGMVYIWHYP